MARSLTGTRIRELRRNSKLSQKDLAQRAGISASYLNLIEHNRRGIAGKTLLALAGALDVSPRTLSDGADQGLVDRIKEAASKAPNIKAEADRAEEFIGRFPGYARLLRRLQDQTDEHQSTFAALSDQMSHDPFFAEAVHFMLSNITTIKSTAEILANTDDVDPQVQARFLSNLLAEADRLATTAQDVLEHFEPSAKTDQHSADRSAFEVLLEQNNFYLPQIEEQALSPAAVLAEADLNETDYNAAVSSIASYSKMARRLPAEPFLQAAIECRFNPLKLAESFDVDLAEVCFRLAHLPNREGVPRFGLLDCDGAGGVLYRKQLPSLSLPRFASACPLWPIYRSLANPMQPLEAFMDFPTGERFLSYSYAYPIGPAVVGMPRLMNAVMIFTADYDDMLPKQALAHRPQLDVGLQCTVCPRPDCAARRTGYILG